VSTPSQVGTDSDWSAVVADQGEGGGVRLGLKMDGTLWAWGYNGDGRVGLGMSSGVVTTPMQVGSSSDWTSVSVRDVSLGIKADGTLWAWGLNWYGQVGQGTSGYSNYIVNAPTQIGHDKDWSYAVSDGIAVLALELDGTLWAWGYNGDGRLGLGYTSEVVSTRLRLDRALTGHLYR
jgi:alpha-tubulin suppressor-like RCC1 family protein